MRPLQFAETDRPAVWRHQLSGGYGYVERIAVEVVRQTAARFVIRAPLKERGTKLVTVRRESLAIVGEVPERCAACAACAITGAGAVCDWPMGAGPGFVLGAGDPPATCPLRGSP